MAYNLFWRTPGVHTYGSKQDIEVPVGQVVSNKASLRFTGKGAANTGKIQQENLMRLLESFAGPTPPEFATVGQFWYDTTIEQLKICISCAPLPVEWRVIRSSITATDVGEPPPLNPLLGDSWFQRTGSASGILYIYTGLGRYPERYGAIGGWEQVWPESDRAAAREEYEIMYQLIDRLVGPVSSRGSGAIGRAIRNLAPLGDLDRSMRNAWRSRLPLDGNVISFTPNSAQIPSQALSTSKFAFTVKTSGIQPPGEGNIYVSGFDPMTGAVGNFNGQIYVNGVLTSLPHGPMWYHQVALDAYVLWDTTSTLVSSSGASRYFMVTFNGSQWLYDTDTVTPQPADGWSTFTPAPGMYLIGQMTTSLNGSTANDALVSYIQPWDNAVELVQTDNDALKIEVNSCDWDALLAAGRYALNRIDVPANAISDLRQIPYVTDGRQPDASLLALPQSDVRFPPQARRASRRFGSVTLARYFNEANSVLNLAMQNRYIMKGLLGASGSSSTFNTNVSVTNYATFQADASGTFGTSTKNLVVRMRFNSREELERYFFAAQAIEIRVGHAPSTNTPADLNLRTACDGSGRFRITASNTFVMTQLPTPSLLSLTTNGVCNIGGTEVTMAQISSGTAGVAIGAYTDVTTLYLNIQVTGGGTTSGTFTVIVNTITDNELWQGGRVYPEALPFVPATDVTLGAFTNTTTAVPLTIVRAPQNTNARVGDYAMFSVVARSVPGPLAYQWRRNGVPIAGATSPVYRRLAAIVDSGSTYTCSVSSPSGTVLTSAATLTVSGATAPTINVAGFSARSGANLMRIASFTGDLVNLSAKRNGTSISIDQLGSPLYTIGNNVYVDDDYTFLSNNGDVYQVTATNTGGSVTGSGVVSIIPRTFTLTATNPTVQSGVATTIRVVSELSTDAPIATTNITAGSLPAGLTLDGTFGFVTGIPAGPGTYNFTLRLTPAANYTNIVETFVNATIVVT